MSILYTFMCVCAAFIGEKTYSLIKTLVIGLLLMIWRGEDEEIE